MKSTLKSFVLVVILAAVCTRAEEAAYAKATAEFVAASKKAAPEIAAEKALVTQIIDALNAKELETNEVARKEPQNCLDKIEFVVSRPGAEKERESFCGLLTEKLQGTLTVPAKVWLLKSLERIGKAESVAVEIKLLGDPDELVRETARRALAANPSEESAAALRTTIGTTTESKARAALIETLGFKRVRADMKFFLEETQKPDTALKDAANRALTAQGVVPLSKVGASASQLVGRRQIPDVMAALDSTEKILWQSAIQAVNLEPSNAMTLAVIEKLKTVRPEVKLPLIAELAHRGDKAALPALREQATSDDVSVRNAAIQGIGNLGDASIVPSLMAVAVSGKGDEQKFARDSLERLHATGVDEALIAFVSSAVTQEATEALRLLAARNSSIATPAVLKQLTATDAAVRTEAIKTLGAIGNKDAIEPVLAVVAKGIDADRDVAAKTLVAIARRLPESAGHLEAIANASKEGAEPARIALLTALGQLGGSKALDAVHAANKDPNEKIQDAAFRALTNWPDATPMNELLDIAKTATNETRRVLALRGFVRMAALPGVRSAGDMLALFASAQDATKTPDDRKLILNALSDIKDFGAVEACAKFIADPKVSEEACLATVKAAKRFESGHGARLSPILKDVLDHVKNKATKEQAQALLDKQPKK